MNLSLSGVRASPGQLQVDSNIELIESFKSWKLKLNWIQISLVYLTFEYTLPVPLYNVFNRWGGGGEGEKNMMKQSIMFSNPDL